jgi:hypothetical protein
LSGDGCSKPSDDLANAPLKLAPLEDVAIEALAAPVSGPVAATPADPLVILATQASAPGDRDNRSGAAAKIAPGSTSFNSAAIDWRYHCAVSESWDKAIRRSAT